MDMDRDSLELMLNLLDTDCNIKTALEGHRELAKNKQKVLILSQMYLLTVRIDIEHPGDRHLHRDESRRPCWQSQH